MLVRTHPFPARGSLRQLQQGIVLVIVLIVLVAMTMAGIALMRSVNTSTIVTGNLAFRQSATASGDIGIETAITWLQTNASQLTGTAGEPFGYVASQQGTPSTASGKDWETYWTTTLDPNPVARPVAAPVLSGNVWTLPPDGAGNTVSYVIHRLCDTKADILATGSNCAVSVTSNTTDGQSKGAGGGPPLKAIYQTYYRITARIEGPRNTVSYVQTIVSM